MVHTAVEVLLKEVVKQAGSNRRRKLISYNAVASKASRRTKVFLVEVQILKWFELKSPL